MNGVFGEDNSLILFSIDIDDSVEIDDEEDVDGIGETGLRFKTLISAFFSSHIIN